MYYQTLSLFFDVPYSYIKPIPFGDTFSQKTFINSNLLNLYFHISFNFSLAKCFFRRFISFYLPPPPLLPHHTQEIMIWTNLNLHNQRMLLHKFELFCPNGFWEVFQKFSLYSKVKVHPPLWSLPNLRDHDLPQLEFTLLEDDSQQTFLAQTFMNRLSKTFSIYSNVFECILYIKSMWNLTPPSQ